MDQQATTGTDADPVTLASRDMRAVYAFVGRDRYLRRLALDGLLKGIAGEREALDLTQIEGPDADVAGVLDEVRTLSLFGGRRVVVVDQADPFISANRAALERYCSDPATNGCLMLLCDSLAKNTRLYKIVSRVGSVIACEPPKGRALISWLTRQAPTMHRKRLAEAGARLLVDHLGESPGVLDAELAKLAAFVEPRDEITPADVDAVTGHHREELVFAVTDAMSAGDAATALRAWRRVLATDRAAGGRALGGLAWGIRRLLETKRDYERGVPVGELARRLYTDPASLERRLRPITVEQLEGQQRDLLAADLAVKTGASTLEVAVEKFIVKHSLGSTPTPGRLLRVGAAT